MDELSGIFGKQQTTTTPANTLIPPYHINAAHSPNILPEKSSVKTSSFPIWIEWINAIADLLRQNNDSPSLQNVPDDDYPHSSFSDDDETSRRFTFNGPSNFLSWRFDDYDGRPLNRDSETRYITPQRQLDTGGANFDRLIIAENEPLGNPFIGKFTRKGLDWSDGNLRVVNVQGNKLLGSELAVRDRSIDIPVQSWLDALNSVFKPSSRTAPLTAQNVR
ncbi:unnamed protein product [Toxocara canis]|uniref:Uncharacterized protein n=1 Tax=Toxocara canis TaxID=6265 RepID=A0A3P7GVL6_TOXCA|nr:unnamed protein product [Toxocara canis]